MKNNIVVYKNKLNNYKLKITTLTPIHIGTGEVYDPTNFVIDNNTFYEFAEVLFYKSLSNSDRQKLNTKLDNWMEIIAFYKSKKKEAKAISHFECKSSDEVQKKYNTIINRNGTKNTNQLEIHKTFKNPNTHRAIIPGSSIKGMLDTVLQIYPKKVKENDIRQNLIVSDALLLNGATQIGYMKRADRDRSQVINKNGGISQIVEVVEKDSSFIASLSTNLIFEDIKSKMKKYHTQRTNSKYKETDASFISRVGKYSGMEYMVDDIKDAVQPGRERKPLSTHSLYLSDGNIEQFGWIKIELISDAEYENSLQDIATQEKEYYDNLERKQKFLKEKIKREKEESLKRKKEKEQKAKEEAERQAKEEADEKARVESLSPLEKIIDEQIKKNPNIPKHTVILNGIDQGLYDAFKYDALLILKKEMENTKKWKPETKAKKPEKDKDYQKTLKVLQMIKICKQ